MEEIIRVDRASRLSRWLALSFFAGALGLGTAAVWALLQPPGTPWWNWGVPLAAGGALLIAAFAPGHPPAESPARKRARYASGAVALLSGTTAVILLPRPGWEFPTAFAFILALAAFGAARWVPFSEPDIAALMGSPAAGATRPRLTWLRGLLAFASLAAALAAATLNRQDHLAGFLLWLASMALLVGALWQRGDAAAARTTPWASTGGPPLSRRSELVGLLLLLALAGALRVPLLTDVPSSLDMDEGRQGYCEGGQWDKGFPDAFDIGWNVFPNLSYLVECSGVLTLGKSLAHLRLSAATMGILSLVPVFFWVRRWWGGVTALIAVFLLAINKEHIWWSRIGLNNMQQVVVAGLLLAAFARLLQRRTWLDWAWLGFATGLAFHTYHAAKLFPVLLAAAALLFAAGIRGFLRTYLSGALVGLYAFVLCLGPLPLTIYRQWNGFYAGTSNRFDVARLMDAHDHGDTAGVRYHFFTHVEGCLLSFVSVPIAEMATFNLLEVVPFVLGVCWMLWCWRDPRHLVVLLWTFGILVVGGMLTADPPWKARLLGYLPTACLIPALVAARGRGLLFRWSPKWADAIAVPLLFVWLGASLYSNWHTEFIFLVQQQRRGDVVRETARVIRDTPLPATFYFARGGGTADLKVATHHGLIAASPDRVLVDLPNDADIVPVPPSNRGTAVLLVTGYQRELVPLIRHYYPDAPSEVVYTPEGQATLYVFRMSDGYLARRRGLRATYSDARHTWSSETAVHEYSAPRGAAFPLQAEWRGLVSITAPGTYAFRSSGDRLLLDGTALSPDGRRELAAGWHLLQQSATLRHAGEKVLLEWQTPDSPRWSPIPAPYLLDHPEVHGLLGRYFREAIEQAPGPARIDRPADYEALAPVLCFDYLWGFDNVPVPPFAALPSTMEWSGTVRMPEAADTVRLEATTPTQVFLGGTLVVATRGQPDGAPIDTPIAFRDQPVPILVRTVRPAGDRSPFWKLRLLWRVAGGGWTAFARYRP